MKEERKKEVEGMNARVNLKTNEGEELDRFDWIVNVFTCFVIVVGYWGTRCPTIVTTTII